MWGREIKWFKSNQNDSSSKRVSQQTKASIHTLTRSEDEDEWVRLLSDDLPQGE